MIKYGSNTINKLYIVGLLDGNTKKKYTDNKMKWLKNLFKIPNINDSKSIEEIHSYLNKEGHNNIIITYDYLYNIFHCIEQEELGKYHQTFKTFQELKEFIIKKYFLQDQRDQKLNEILK